MTAYAFVRTQLFHSYVEMDTDPTGDPADYLDFISPTSLLNAGAEFLNTDPLAIVDRLFGH